MGQIYSCEDRKIGTCMFPEPYFYNMNNEPKYQPKPKPEDEETPVPDRFKEYMGNIWGWKNSMVGLIIILIFLTMAIVRYCQVQPDSFYVRDIDQLENQNTTLEK